MARGTGGQDSGLGQSLQELALFLSHVKTLQAGTICEPKPQSLPDSTPASTSLLGSEPESSGKQQVSLTTELLVSQLGGLLSPGF